MITLVYGGSGSGKSEFAEQQILNCSGPEHRYYIATMIAYGAEERERIRRHVALRAGKSFATIECPTDLPNILAQIDPPQEAAVLLECVSNLTANEMFGNQLGARETEDKVVEAVRHLCSQVKHAVIVTNNLYDDGMDYDPSTVTYAEVLGNVNRHLAALADEIFEVVAGIPVRIKGKEAAERKAEMIKRHEEQEAAERKAETCQQREEQEAAERKAEMIKRHEEQESFGSEEKAERRTKMRLVIGGYAQGKLEYVIRGMQTEYCVIDETTYQSCAKDLSEAGASEPSGSSAATTCPCSSPTVIVNHLHQIIREIGQREAADEWIRNMIGSCAAKGQDLVFICDEVGSGVIPIEAKERQFREDTGRILCDLAREADRVERIICGIPQVLK